MPIAIKPTGADQLTIEAIERIRAKIKVVGFGCWLWQGRLSLAGYGQVSVKGKTRAAHRVLYELANGNSDLSLYLDHTCRTKSCVNPKHLEQVTPKENTRRGFGPTALNMKKTHCHRGHSLSDDNLYLKVRNRQGNKIERTCRRCHVMDQIRSRYKIKALNKQTTKEETE